MSNVLNIARHDEKLEQVREYLHTSRDKRLPMPVVLHDIKVRRNEYAALKYEIEEFDKAVAKANVRAVQERVMGGDLDEPSPASEEVGQEWLDNHWLEVIQYVFESAKKGNAQSQKLFAQLAGKLVEKSEVKIGLTADERLRREIEAERQLGEFHNGRGTGYRVEEVSEKLPLLSK